MDYTDTAGNPATGVVWSPGPLPGTVWVLPHAGAPASSAAAVDIAKRREIPEDRIRARRSAWTFDRDAHESDTARRLAPKDWHAALGYDPRAVVAAGEHGPDVLTLDDIATDAA